VSSSKGIKKWKPITAMGMQDSQQEEERKHIKPRRSEAIKMKWEYQEIGREILCPLLWIR